MFLDPCAKVYHKGEVYQGKVVHFGELRKMVNSASVSLMDVTRVRLLNLDLIIKEKYQGKKSHLAEALGIKASYVSRYYTNKPSHKRNISNEMARQVERAADMPHGWMDAAHELLWESDLNVRTEERGELPVTPRERLTTMLAIAERAIIDYSNEHQIKFTDEQIYKMLLQVLDFAGSQQFSDDFVKQYILELVRKS